MAITYTWTVTGLMVTNSPEPDTAVMSNFTISGKDENDKTGQVSYAVNLLPADVENFTPYADITAEQAVEWTKAALDSTGPNEEGLLRTQAMEQEVAEQIAQQYIPYPEPAPLPWEPQAAQEE